MSSHRANIRRSIRKWVRVAAIDMPEILWKFRISNAFAAFARAFVAISSGVLIAIVVTVASCGQSPVVGDGTLVPAPGSPYISGPQTSVVASGDFNGDGLADLVVATSE